MHSTFCRYFSMIVVCCMFTAISVQAQQVRTQYAADADIPYSSQLKKGMLANGLTYYLQKNAKPAQKVELRLVVKVGSIVEDDDQRGLAHFVEHMAFNGSKHFRKNELVSYLESIGVKFGADLNAYTGFDETVYILPIPTDKPDNLEKGMLVLSDWAQGLSFEHEEIDRERGVVLEEARLGKGARDRLQKQLLPKILHGSKYAERLPIGTEDSLKTFSDDALKRFYGDWYRPNLMAVVVVGDLEYAAVESLIMKYFAGLKNPSKARVRTIADVPARVHEEVVIATDKEATLATISISQARFLNQNDGKFGSYRQRRIESFFNTMLNNRLAELAQLPSPPFLGAGSGIQSLIGQYQELNSSAIIGKAGVPAAIDALMQEHTRVLQFGFSEAELNRAKSNALKGMENAYVERHKSLSADLAAEFIRNFLIGESIPGIEAEFIFHRDIVQDISLAELNHYAKSLLSNTDPKLIAYQGHDQAAQSIPDPVALKQMVKAAQQKDVTPYVEKTVVQTLMESPPKPGTIVSSTENPLLGTTEWTLSNGIKIVLKPTDFSQDQILMTAVRAGGSALISDEDYLHARYATTVVGAMGVKNISPIELSKYLAGKRASVSTSFGEHAEGISGSSNNQDLETMLQVMYLALTAPRRDPVLFESFIGKQQEALRHQMATPSAVFHEKFIQTSYPAHPRLPLLDKPEQIAQLDLDRLMRIYQSRFSSAKGFTFFLVGSFKAEQIKTLLLRYLGSLPTPALEVGVKDLGLRPRRGVIKNEVFVGKEQQALVTLQLHGERPMPLADRMRFNAMAEVLQLRLTAIMREELGAVYSPRVTASPRLIPYQGYSLMLALPSGPEHVDQLLRRSFALFEQMKSAPATEDELRKVKENWLMKRKESLKTNGFWLASLSSSFEHQEDPMRILSYEERVKLLTTTDIQDAAKRYLDTENYIQIIMYPEKSSTESDKQ